MSFSNRLIAGVATWFAIGCAVRFWIPVKTKTLVKQWIFSGRLQSFLLLAGVVMIAVLLIQRVIIRVLY